MTTKRIVITGGEIRKLPKSRRWTAMVSVKETGFHAAPVLTGHGHGASASVAGKRALEDVVAAIWRKKFT